MYYANFVDFKKETILEESICPNCGSKISKKNLTRKFITYFDPVLKDTFTKAESKEAVIFLSGANAAFKIPNIYDEIILDKIAEITNIDFHTERLPEGDESRRNDKIGITHTHQFYTLRNFIALSRIYELVKDDIMLLAWFTSCLFSTSKMNKFRFSGTGTTSGTFYISSLNREFNVFNTLKRKIGSFAQCDYKGRNNGVIHLISATNLNLDDNCVDYVFVDPPFGANIMYSELNSLWESWIRVKTDNTKEAIVNKTQGKTLFQYQELMDVSFSEFYRVLKPGKWLTIEFSNTSASVWNSIQNALQSVGFIIANVSSLDKMQGSFKAVTTTTAVKQDLIISCFKPSQTLLTNFEVCRDKVSNAWDFVLEILEHLPIHLKKGLNTTAIVERSPKILYDRLIAYYVQHGYPVPMDAHEFQQGLRERFVERDGMFFTAAQAIEYEEKKKLAPEFVPMGLIVSDEANGIEWLKQELKQPQTYQEIQPKWFQAINAVRKNDIIPGLDQLLEENFIEEPNGKWRLPNIQDDKDVMALRTKSLMREFKLYVEQASKPKAKIKEARVEALRAGFKQCYIDKDFKTIVMVGDKIPQNLRDEDEVLLQFYDIALNKL